MRILINAVAAKLGGALRHLDNFTRVLSQVDKKNEYLIFTDNSINLTCSSNVTVMSIRDANKSFFHRVYWDQITIPSLIKRHNIDLVLSILNFGPIKVRVRQIVFQRNPTYFCKYYLDSLKGNEKIHVILKRRLTYMTMKASECIVTPTLAMRDMIREFYPSISERKFKVIPHGFDEDFFLERHEPLPQRVEELIEKESRDGFVKLLYVTHPGRHKGFEVLFKTLHLLVKRGMKVKLFLTTSFEDWHPAVKNYTFSWPMARAVLGNLIDELGIKENIVMLGRVSPNSITGIYKKCDIFIFPSLCESFGFPMVEAMSMSLPIVAADTRVNREILGESALYYNDPLDFAKAADRVNNLATDIDLRRELSLKSKERFDSIDWSWKRYINQLLEIIG